MTAAERQRRRRAQQFRDNEQVTKPAASFRDNQRVTELERALAVARSENEDLRQQVEGLWRLSRMTREEAMLILRCLHPDSRGALSGEMLGRAFIAWRRVMDATRRADEKRRADEEARRTKSERAKAAWAKRRGTTPNS